MNLTKDEIEHLESRYVMIKKGQLYYFLGGAITIIILAIGLTYASVLAAVKSSGVKTALAEIETAKKQAVLDANELRKIKNDTPNVFTVVLPDLVSRLTKSERESVAAKAAHAENIQALRTEITQGYATLRTEFMQSSTNLRAELSSSKFGGGKPVKLCRVIIPGKWQDTFPVPDSTSREECHALSVIYQDRASNHWSVGCIDPDGTVHLGPEGGAPPPRNCGW